MRILIVNDDGIKAPGIAKLAEKAKKYGEVTVMAPAGQCSAMSQRITIYEGLKVSRENNFPVEGVKAYAVVGTPADCVRAGLWSVTDEEKPDVVFSGINAGYNAGTDNAYSGTVGAAMEALLSGIPAIAFSTEKEGRYDTFDKYADEVIEKFLGSEHEADKIWNVNFPGCDANSCSGIVYDRKTSAKGFYYNFYEKEGGEENFFLRINGYPLEKGSEGSDVEALLSNKVSVGKIKCMVM